MDVLSTGQIIIGTATNLLIKSDIQGNSELMLSGHFNSANFVATHPFENIFASVGHDKLLRIINLDEQNYLGNFKVLEDKANTVGYSQDGQQLAIGFEDGYVRVYKTTDLSNIAEVKTSNRPIVHAKFSPDNEILAVAAGSDIKLLKATDQF